MNINKDIKILIIDDMSIMRKLIKKMLTQMGFTNLSDADDGITAWPLIEKAIEEKSPFEFIISDWNMPEMNGIDLLKKVRSTSGIEKTPFLIITAEAEEGNLEIAIEAGVSSFIHKPFTEEILKEKLDLIFK